MPRYEYKILRFRFSDAETKDCCKLEGLLNELGGARWELISHKIILNKSGKHLNCYIFKRRA